MAATSASRAASFRPPVYLLVAFAAASAVAAGLAGPFGMAITQPNPLARVAHFLICSATLCALTIGAAEILDRFWPKLGLWALAISAVLASLPGALVVQVSLQALSPASLARVGWIDLLVQTLPMNLILSLLGWRVLGGRLEGRRIATLEQASGPGLSQRLPPEYRSAPILALVSEDHYLRVHTQRGAPLIHMRISDAEQLLASEGGVRTHRSFWVSRRALSRVERKEGRMTLILENGMVVPVSRARVEAVNAWLAGGPPEAPQFANRTGRA